MATDHIAKDASMLPSMFGSLARGIRGAPREFSKKPGLKAHHSPGQWEPRDVAGAIVAYLKAQR